MSRLINEASIFAKYHHEAVGQLRKYTGEPYIIHPARVALTVRSVPGATEEMIAAAWLHDTVEDTNATLADIERSFGVTVATYVEMLTDVSRPEDGNRAKRKEIDLAHTALACPQAKTIKLADLIDNMRSITKHDPKFALIYLPEKLALLDVLMDGDNGLWHMAHNMCLQAMLEI